MLGFLFREVALGAEETTMKGFVAHSGKGRFEIFTVLLGAGRGSQSLASVSEKLL